MKIKSLFVSFAVILSLFLTGCNNSQDVNQDQSKEKEEDILTIYTTLFPLEDFAKKIGGEYVEVKNIIPPGSNAHTYEPTPQTMIEIAEADAFFFSGNGLESYAEAIAESLKNEDVLIVEASKGVNLIERDQDHDHEQDHEAEQHETNETDTHVNVEEAHEHEDHNQNEALEENEHTHNHGDKDPHVWLDPIRAIVLAENIKNTLVELKPEAKDVFEKNFATLKNELKALDHEFHEVIDAKTNRKILVSHAAYGYWEENYGIEQIAISGLSSTNEPSQKQLQEIIEIAKENDIEYVIFEQNVTPRVAEVVRKEINAEPIRLHNLAVLTEEDIQNNEDYFSLMRKNIETLDLAMK